MLGVIPFRYGRNHHVGRIQAIRKLALESFFLLFVHVWRFPPLVSVSRNAKFQEGERSPKGSFIKNASQEVVTQCLYQFEICFIPHLHSEVSSKKRE